ncbi:hypothetical protein [Chitinophaga sp. HK235]|uniref:hypothetical protein n=1 Tax=Chitinophaga sp. HK235 TaxID=2952571 RepID=UPI001BA5AEC9|nr:hypothetical protein [Chitinophaga sp. HK235]
MLNKITPTTLHTTGAKLEDYSHELLLKPLSHHEKCTFHAISSYNAKGLHHARGGRIHQADHYFTRSKHYMDKLPIHTHLWHVLQLDYLLKKTYYLYKTRNLSAATAMVEDTMLLFKHMEAKGYHHLFFERIQQYHHVARIAFAAGKAAQAVQTASQILIFLLSGSAPLLPDLKIPAAEHATYYQQRGNLSFYQVMPQTLKQLTKQLHGPLFLHHAHHFLVDLIPAVQHYQPQTTEQELIRNYVLLFESFCLQQYSTFHQQASAFLEADNGFPDDARISLQLFVQAARQALQGMVN